MSDSAYRMELMWWLNRPQWSGDGIRRRPRRGTHPDGCRPGCLSPNQGMPIEPGGDLGAAYLVVYGDSDEARDWFVGGEAASAVLLTATSLGLAVAPMSDLIEVTHPRQLVASLLPAAGFPYLVIRVGWPLSDDELDHSPRRGAGESIVGLTED
jgi:hypothetical protein